MWAVPRGARAEAYLWAVLDRGVLHRQHVHVTPATLAALATFATLGFAAAIVRHKLVYGFAGDSGGQVGRHLTRGQVLTALHISKRVPGACTRPDLAGRNNVMDMTWTVE